jgi:SAM-dependent methyltransferase
MPSKSGVIYDLGSGTARAVLAAPFLHTFHRVVGIELLENLHDAAVKCLGRYEAMVSAGEAPACDIELICGSFFDYDWSDGDVIFANSTCFSDEMFEEIGKRCVTLRSGAIVITFSVELTGEHLETLHQMELVMSWGKVNVFIHKRI